MSADTGRRLDLSEVGVRQFEIVEHGRHYRMKVSGLMVCFEFDRARWERNELIGELIVSTDVLGTDAIDGVLSRANFNVSSARARTERAKTIEHQARSPEIPWAPLLEEFCQRILTVERAGEPSIDLRRVEREPFDAEIECLGLQLARRHPVIAFGDGGTLKSYIGLLLAGTLSQAGYRVGYFDWELAAEDHRDRLEHLFGADMPEVRYVRCERPLIYEVDRLKQIRENDGLDYTFCDSISFACDGPPEAAEVAARYFQMTRQLRIGSFHIAHVTKAETGDQKPFGSAFWHNGARATWFIKPAEAMPDHQVVSLGVFPRKRNLGPLPRALGYEFAFGNTGIQFRRIDVADVNDLASRLPINQRMTHLLRRGAMTHEAIATELDEDVESIKRIARRHRDRFIVLAGGRLGLLERGA
jgi:hypothetical protein